MIEMKRQIIFCGDCQIEFDAVSKLLDEGWILDPSLTDGKPYRLENATVWPLVLYESEEEKPKLIEEEKVGEFDDVVDVKSVEFAEVAGLVKEGYVVQSIYAKNTIMVKRVEKK